MNNWKLTLTILVLVLASGCAGRNSLADPAYYIQPTIAVMKFENRAPFPYKWDLGDGMADILVDRLVSSKRYHVIERVELESVLRELDLQDSGITRQQRRALRGRVKNVQYLIKGTVTDFGHVSSASAWLRDSSWGLFGSHARAVMGMTFYVVDVESGEVVVSSRLEQSVSASEIEVKGTYDGVALGGSVFYRTPLGRVTAKVMDRAVMDISTVIASKRWQARIAAVENADSIVLNGGANRMIAVGQEAQVFEPGEVILDPVTGDVLGRRAPKELCKLVVTDVRPRYCIAKITKGNHATLRVGQPCRLIGGVTPKLAGKTGSRSSRPRKYRTTGADPSRGG